MAKFTDYSRMKILGVIPARYQSTRFPGKPLAMINGKTMIRRVYEQALKSSGLTDVVIATDDQRIFSEVESFGGKVFPSKTEHLNGTTRCFEVFKHYNENNSGNYHGLINIQGDEPYIKPEQINAVANLLSDNNTEVATLAKKITHNDELLNPNIVKIVFSKTNSALYFSRSAIPFLRSAKNSEWLKHTNYHKHIGIYGFSKKSLNEFCNLKDAPIEDIEKLEQLRAIYHAKSITMVKVTSTGFGIDTKEDLARAIEIFL